jgi:hypothetical protein
MIMLTRAKYTVHSAPKTPPLIGERPKGLSSLRRYSVITPAWADCRRAPDALYESAPTKPRQKRVDPSVIGKQPICVGKLEAQFEAVHRPATKQRENTEFNGSASKLRERIDRHRRSLTPRPSRPS